MTIHGLERDVPKLPRATLRQKIEVLDYIAGPPPHSQADALNHFKQKSEFAVSQATLSNWTSNEQNIRAEYNSNPNLTSYKKKPVLKYPDVTLKVEKHIADLIANGELVTNKIIRDTYTKIMLEHGYSESASKISTGMVKSFRKRNTLNNANVNKNLDFDINTSLQIHEHAGTVHPDHLVPRSPQISSMPSLQINENIDSSYAEAENLDFNFDDIFINNTIGFNTRLIHSDDSFPVVSSLGTIDSIVSAHNGRLSPLFTNNTPNLNHITTQTSNADSLAHILPDPQSSKRKLPYYPTYQNPLNNISSYKRQQHGINSSNTTLNGNNDNNITGAKTITTSGGVTKNFSNSIGSKISNPNSEKIEKILENITDGSVTLYNSGTSAIMGILSCLNPTHVFINDEGYKGTHDVIKFLNKLTNVKKHSLLKLSGKYKLPKNSVIIIESPMNPLGYVHDISYYAKLSQTSPSCKLIVDSTLAPPPLQFPFKHGADHIVYSAVKYLAGVSDLSAGFIVSKDKESKMMLHTERSALGTSIANFDSFLLVRSLKTYKMRILTQCNNTEKIIKYLQKHFTKYDAVLTKIHHASLQPNRKIIMNQLNGYYNPVFALELKNSIFPDLLLKRFNFLSNNPNLEGGETLVELIHGNPNFNYDSEDTSAVIDGDNNYKKMLRFSVGCEDFQDIIRDIDQAFLGLIVKQL